MNPIKFTLQFTDSDLEQAIPLIISASTTIGWLQRWLSYYTFVYPVLCKRIAIGLMVIAAVLILFLVGSTLEMMIIWAVFLFPAGTLLWLATKGRKKTLDYFRAYYIAREQQSALIEINEECISAKNASGEGKAVWSSLVRAVYNKHCLLLYLSPVSTIVVPARLLSPDEWADVIVLVRAHIQDVQEDAG